MTREELDGRHDSKIARPCPWAMSADKWNDPGYEVTSSAYHRLHDEFRHPLNLNHSNVNGMGHLTPAKAKAKFTTLKNNLVLVKTKWTASGNGDGSVLQQEEVQYDSDGNELDEDESGIVTCNANDLSNFIKGYSPAVLYLWKKAEECDFVSVVCQQLDQECALDSSNGQVSLITPQKRKKRKDRSAEDEAEGKEEYSNLHKVLSESNECMKDSTRKMMGMDIAAAIRELQTKIEDCEDKLDDLGTDEDVVASVKYRRILD